MPHVKRGNPSKSSFSRNQGFTSSSFGNDPLTERVVCDVCVRIDGLSRIRGTDVVLCFNCRATAENELGEKLEAIPISSQKVVGPHDESLRGVAKLGNPNSSDFRMGISEGPKRSRPRRCAYPSCPERVRRWQIACVDHYSLLTPALKAEFRKSFGQPNRRDVWKRIERYLAARKRLMEIAS